jgi:hypothetical protein
MGTARTQTASISPLVDVVELRIAPAKLSR